MPRQELFKGATDDPELLSFSPCGNSACCGVNLEVDNEYLIGLYSDGTGVDLYAESCGLFREWEAVTHAERDELWGCKVDPCGTCDEYQVSLCCFCCTCACFSTEGLNLYPPR